jgi:hypothetical protein
METLQELTGQESGIVIYDKAEAIICNWSHIKGLPRISHMAYVCTGLGEDIPEVQGYQIEGDEIAALMDGLAIIYDVNDDAPALLRGEHTGYRYDLSDTVTVIAPADWN